VKELKGSAEQCSPRPVIHFDGPPSLPCQGCIERRNHAKRAIDDLCCERRVEAAQRGAANLCIERRRGPRVVVNDAVQNASRKLSGRRNHGRTLAWLASRGTEIGGIVSRVIPFRPWGRAAGSIQGG